uniref:Uncharacterized protein n=1 Tax=Arion vulgaris TaxID=1028688 RepID=A0A0B7AFW2_9EUPU
MYTTTNYEIGGWILIQKIHNINIGSNLHKTESCTVMQIICDHKSPQLTQINLFPYFVPYRGSQWKYFLLLQYFHSMAVPYISFFFSGFLKRTILLHVTLDCERVEYVLQFHFLPD